MREVATDLHRGVMERTDNWGFIYVVRCGKAAL